MIELRNNRWWIGIARDLAKHVEQRIGAVITSRLLDINATLIISTTDVNRINGANESNEDGSDQ